MLSRGSNVYGCSLLVEDGHGFSWLPDHIAARLDVPKGPIFWKQDGSFVRLTVQNGKPIMNQSIMKQTEDLTTFREEGGDPASSLHTEAGPAGIKYEEVLETFRIIRQGSQEVGIVLDKGHTSSLTVPETRHYLKHFPRRF